jgi:hypothetical protein
VSERPPRPTALAVKAENIPDELKRWPQWVVWRYEWSEDKRKWDKPPRQVRGGGLASSTDRRTWDTYENALARYQTGGYDGIGFCPSAQDPFVFADHDGVIKDGQVGPPVAELLGSTYAERSPSSTGIRQILKGRLPGKGRKWGQHEVYDQGHYLTITGHRGQSSPAEIRADQPLVDALYELTARKPTRNGDKPEDAWGHNRVYRPGERGGRIRELFGKLNSEGFPLERIVADILWENENHFDPPKTEQEIRDEVRGQWDQYHEQSGQGPAKRGAGTSQERESVEPRALADVEAVWRRWMEGDDLYALRVVLGGYAGNLLPGDPLWLMLVGGSGSGKTEAVSSLARLPDVLMESTITGESALLSATPKRDRGQGATGGLLRQLASPGVLVLKDFTTILAMQRDRRSEVLAALREVYDGEWTRSVGAEGGRRLHWKGKVGIIAGCTGAIDSAHAVIASLGTRFVTPRMPDVIRANQSKRAMAQAGKETQMRAELADAAAGLFADGLPEEPWELTEEELDRLVEIASLVALARSPVERDYRGNLDLVLDSEAPTRIAKELATLYRGLSAIGLGADASLTITIRVGMDCIPKLRRKCLEALFSGEEWMATPIVASTVDHPTTSTRRALEELQAHKLVLRRSAREGRSNVDRWSLTEAARAAIASYTRSVSTPAGRLQGPSKDPNDAERDIYGSSCPACGGALEEHADDPDCLGCLAEWPWCPGCHAHFDADLDPEPAA